MTGIAPRRLSTSSPSVVALALGAGILLALQSWLRTRVVITLNHDSWSYWEGAISIARGMGFTNLDGNPITVWPPGFSAFLALFASDGAVPLGHVRVALILLAFASGIIWAGLGGLEFRQAARPIRLFAALYPTFFFSAYFESLLSEALWIPLTGLIMLVCLHGPRSVARAVLICGLMLALLLTRSLSLALIPALPLFVALRSDREHARSTALSLASAVPLWMVYRTLSGQAGSHGIHSGLAGLLQQLEPAHRALAETWTYTTRGAHPLLLLAGIAGCLLLIQSGQRQSQARRRAIAWLAFTVVLWLTSFLLAAITSVGIAQPRFFLFSGLSLTYALLWAVTLPPSQQLRRLSLLVVVVLTSAALTRSLYFAQFRGTLPASALAADFSPTQAWIVATLHTIDRAVTQGKSLERACAEQGIATSRYFAWKGIAFVCPDSDHCVAAPKLPSPAQP